MTAMGRLDLSGLTDDEAEHVLQVVQRDMKLRREEEKRLSERKQEQDEEGSRCLLLSRQSCFNQRCCIRCCLPFTFLFNPKHQCQDCRFNVCKGCRVYSKQEKCWLCCACQKSRLLKTQSLEWFYSNVKQRFKRFGSAKVLKTLYRKHLAEHGALSELTGSAYEESVCDEGSVCESDSTFCRQSEEHSTVEMLTVALRVAEEAIDEAISKAEFESASQEKQKEAHYLREHRGELVEELARTIVQKIISRRKTLTELRTESNQDWTLRPKVESHYLPQYQQATYDKAWQQGLWRSHSAFSLLDHEDSGSTMSTWKSVDTLDKAGVSSVLKSPDGNWIALQSAQGSHPSLLTKRKSQVYSALERESGVVSAYEGMDSDNETQLHPDTSWGAALQEIHRKMTGSNFALQDNLESVHSPRTSCRSSRDDLLSDSEGNRKVNKALLALFQRKVPVELRRPSASRRTSIIDVHFTAEEVEDTEDKMGKVGRELEVGKVRKSWKEKRKSRKNKVPVTYAVDSIKNNAHSQSSPDAATSDTLTSEGTTPVPEPDCDLTGPGMTDTNKENRLKPQEPPDRDWEAPKEDNEERNKRWEDVDEEDRKTEIDDDRMEDEPKREGDLDIDEELKCRFYKLIEKSRLAYFLSTYDLDEPDQSEVELDENIKVEIDEEEQERSEGLTFKLCRLEKEVKATQFSSTEDELDRVGTEKKNVDDEDGRHDKMVVELCKLANQVKASQFSSTEDELDRAGRRGDRERGTEEDILWKLQGHTSAQLRDLVSLVSTAQFSSTDEELDRVTINEEEEIMKVKRAGSSTSSEEGEIGDEQRKSFADLDVQMFDLMEETKDTNEKWCSENAATKNVTDDRIKTDSKTEETSPEKYYLEKSETEHVCEDGSGNAKEGEEREEIMLKSEYNEQEKSSKEELRKEKWRSATSSEDEDAELDRIISSMLTLTLENMQGKGCNQESAESSQTKDEQKGDVKESTGNAQKHAGEDERAQGGDNDMPSVDVSTEEETEEVTGENKNKQEERVDGHRDRRNVLEQRFNRRERDIMDRSKEMETEAELMRTQDDAAEEHCVGTDMQGHFEEQRTSLPQEGFPTAVELQQVTARQSAASLRGITTEILMVLNATEEMMRRVDEIDGRPSTSSPPLLPNTLPKRLDEQFSRLEENVYMAAGSVYSLETELSDLEECARGIASSMPDMELSFLEEQVASVAVKVQESELQINDISSRIAALKRAGLNVGTQARFTSVRST